jgi:hypothetical protein
MVLAMWGAWAPEVGAASERFPLSMPLLWHEVQVVVSPHWGVAVLWHQTLEQVLFVEFQVPVTTPALKTTSMDRSTCRDLSEMVQPSDGSVSVMVSWWQTEQS